MRALAGAKPRTQDLLQISQENVAISRFGNGHRRFQPSRGQCRQHGQDLPSTLRRSLVHSLAAGSTTVVAGHLRRGSTLVEKNQLLDIELNYGFSPGLAAALRGFTILLLCVERFF